VLCTGHEDLVSAFPSMRQMLGFMTSHRLHGSLFPATNLDSARRFVARKHSWICRFGQTAICRARTPADSQGTKYTTSCSPTPEKEWLHLPGPPKVVDESMDDETPMYYLGGPISMERQVFCNRSLNMASISAIGFDMDYTLAQYRPESFETMVHGLTVQQLVSVFHYPEELLASLEFDWQYMIRGLTLDKKRGNILKIDRHKYVKMAHHGFSSLSREERIDTYNRCTVQESFDDKERYMLIDTLFSLAEAYLFMQLVELKDKHPKIMPRNKAYSDLYRDIRGAVDLCHRDGSLKRAVASDPDKYIYKDSSLVPLLKQIRKSGRKVFLATNSLWDYTHVVMNFLISNRRGSEKTEEWLEHFDAVITGCGKPGFFTERKPLFQVHLATGMLYNTDGGSPLVPVGEEDLPKLVVEKVIGAASSNVLPMGGNGSTAPCRVFQGGYYTDLHSMLSIQSGAEVLYVGDHIYGDIVRSKKSLGWRTMIVFPELEADIRILQEEMGTVRELEELCKQRITLEDEIDRMEWQIENGIPTGSQDEDPEDEERFRDVIANLKVQVARLLELYTSRLNEYNRKHHPVWGQLMKVGVQSSRFAHQIDRYACLYTSHVANMLFYSMEKNFRAKVDLMPHEEELQSGGLRPLASTSSHDNDTVDMTDPFNPEEPRS